MTYILAEIDNNGYIKLEEEYDYIGYDDNRRTRIVHKETVNLDKQDGIRVFDKLEAAKSEWSGVESDEAILSLDDAGAVENIWMAERQSERLEGRLKIWSSCYGGWVVKKLNA